MAIYEKYKDIIDKTETINGDFVLRSKLSEIIPSIDQVESVLEIVKRTYAELRHQTSLDYEGDEDFDYTALFFPRYKLFELPKEDASEGYILLLLTAYGSYMSVSLIKHIEN